MVEFSPQFLSGTRGDEQDMKRMYMILRGRSRAEQMEMEELEMPPPHGLVECINDQLVAARALTHGFTWIGLVLS